MKFQVNEGPLDRVLRVTIGVVLVAIAAAGIVGAPVVYGVLAAATIGLVTGITGFCPTYTLFGFSTQAAAHR
jgi:multisubunit Na+/H+ antiporter MnhG subunit